MTLGVSLIGPSGAGKTFLANRIAGKCGARILNCCEPEYLVTTSFEPLVNRCTKEQVDSMKALNRSLVPLPRLRQRSIYMWSNWGTGFLRASQESLAEDGVFLVEEGPLKKLIEVLPLHDMYAFNWEKGLRSRWLPRALTLEMELFGGLCVLIPELETLSENLASRVDNGTSPHRRSQAALLRNLQVYASLRELLLNRGLVTEFRIRYSSPDRILTSDIDVAEVSQMGASRWSGSLLISKSIVPELR